MNLSIHQITEVRSSEATPYENIPSLTHLASSGGYITLMIEGETQISITLHTNNAEVLEGFRRLEFALKGGVK